MATTLLIDPPSPRGDTLHDIAITGEGSAFDLLITWHSALRGRINPSQGTSREKACFPSRRGNFKVPLWRTPAVLMRNTSQLPQRQFCHGQRLRRCEGCCDAGAFTLRCAHSVTDQLGLLSLSCVILAKFSQGIIGFYVKYNRCAIGPVLCIVKSFPQKWSWMTIKTSFQFNSTVEYLRKDELKGHDEKSMRKNWTCPTQTMS